MANLEKIKDVRDCRRDNSKTVLQLRMYYEQAKAFDFSVDGHKGLVDKGYVNALLGEYENIIEYLVERLVHSESERFSK